MRRWFTDAEDAAMAAAAKLLEGAGYRPNGRTVSKRIQGRDVGGGALRFQWGPVQRATVGPRQTYFCSVEDHGEFYDKRWIDTGNIAAIAEELKRRGASAGAPAPVRMRTAETWGRRYFRSGYAKRTTD